MGGNKWLLCFCCYCCYCCNVSEEKVEIELKVERVQSTTSNNTELDNDHTHHQSMKALEQTPTNHSTKALKGSSVISDSIFSEQSAHTGIGTMVCSLGTDILGAFDDESNIENIIND